MIQVVIKKGHPLEYMTLWVTWSYERKLYVTVNGTTFRKEEVTELIKP
jgi:thymidylate synthase ThyX